MKKISLAVLLLAGGLIVSMFGSAHIAQQQPTLPLIAEQQPTLPVSPNL